MRWFATLFVLACGPAMALCLNLVVFPNPGLFDVEAGQPIGGPGGALLVRLGRVSGLTLNLESMPIPRALAAGAAAPGGCLVGLTRTPEREAHFQWIGPLASGALTVYARGDETRPLRDGSDLRGHSVVVQRESAAANWLRQQGIAPQEANHALSALRMLQAGRVDFWLANNLMADPVIQAEGGAPVRPHLVVARIDVYIACHPGTAPDAMARLQQAIQRLRRQGDLAEFGLR
jgi:polar amino acid transport system substrate-binding protein